MTGIFFVLPCIEDYTKVDLRTVTFDIPPQEVSLLFDFYWCIVHILLVVGYTNNKDSVEIYDLLLFIYCCWSKLNIFKNLWSFFAEWWLPFDGVLGEPRSVSRRF